MPLIEAVTRPPHLTARAQAHPPRAWYEIRNAADADEAELLIYDEIGGWWGNTPGEIVDELRAVTAPNLRVRINSPGGSVFDGIAIANAIRLHPANVTVQVDGIAASAASVIAMAGDRIVMTPQSQLMIHDAGGVCFGNAADMTEMAALLDIQSDNIADAYAERAGGTREEWRERMRAESWYLAQEAVDAGLADEVLPSRRAEEPEPALTNSWDLSVFRYAGREAAPAPGPATGGTLTASLATVGEGPVCDGPTLPARPVPSPPSARFEMKGEHGPELTFTAGSVLTAEMVALLHAATAPAEPETPAVENRTTELEPTAALADELPDPAVAPAAAADEPEWATAVARLMTPPPSADDEFTRLKEALL
ncbi:ATP-dependent protease ClpP, protease subunit [Streptomyces sp. ScaeMP-e48]|uniref:head maturation protease, ClpP-related n=1 Tax=Streptomyces sp. ScaeMP-e48 TaxID=1100823 RepID=UPI000823E2E3|nr:head maturation protease, ClpP-related [Streptomyces sp. ScaeMP-e48]SCK20134.1 ATP-dependent protease ClpP, protease subunit [Streptomyces sp. ScaeMP-e48]